LIVPPAGAGAHEAEIIWVLRQIVRHVINDMNPKGQNRSQIREAE